MRTVKWKLSSGSKDGQESNDLKRKKGLEYIEVLKKEHNVKEVIETNNEFIIHIEE